MKCWHIYNEDILAWEIQGQLVGAEQGKNPTKIGRRDESSVERAKDLLAGFSGLIPSRLTAPWGFQTWFKLPQRSGANKAIPSPLKRKYYTGLLNH